MENDAMRDENTCSDVLKNAISEGADVLQSFGQGEKLGVRYIYDTKLWSAYLLGGAIFMICATAFLWFITSLPLVDLKAFLIMLTLSTLFSVLAVIIVPMALSEWRARKQPALVFDSYRLAYREGKWWRVWFTEILYADIARVEVEGSTTRLAWNLAEFVTIHKMDGSTGQFVLGTSDFSAWDLMAELKLRAPHLKQPYSTVRLLVAQPNSPDKSGS